MMHRINAALERFFPERRLFLRSDSETRFIRLKPVSQAIGVCGAMVVLAWSIVATAILLMDSVGSGTVREQARREQSLYETRLDALSQERDQSAAAAAQAQQRFNLALDQISAMQSLLLASEDHRKELETGIEVIQKTLRRTMNERDAARAAGEEARLALATTGGGVAPASPEADIAQTLDFVTAALEDTAGQRDAMAAASEAATRQAELAALETRQLQERNDVIFRQLEDAVTISLEPLDKMFRAAGLSTDDVLATVRRGYSGQGGPLSPLTLSTSGAALDPNAARANGILGTLDTMNLYRIAAQQLPFAVPVQSTFRFTSGFGYRNDPKGAGTRLHTGTDFASDYGTPIYTTGDGTVTQAGWENGYGRMITVQHAFGIETRYAHLSQIRVTVGERVSRGDRIGDMGNSGRSTGTHLHYEVRVGGSPVNPMTYIKAANDVF
jgi:murein DD-endopeptidase MepM/ murein hydrolase activator NlpD